MKKMKFAGLFIVMLMISLQTSFAQSRAGARPDGPGSGDPYRNIPNLTEAQQTEIRAIHTAHLNEVKPLRNQLDIKEAELNALRSADNANMTNINAKADEIAQIKTEIAKLKLANEQNVRNVLTEEQKAFFDMHYRTNGGNGHHGNGNGNGNGAGGCGNSCGGCGGRR